VSRALLEVDELCVDLHSAGGRVRLVDGVSFEVASGETVGLVGESGSGKSLTALSIMQLFDTHADGDFRLSGEVRLAGKDLLRLRRNEIEAVRGDRIAMVFQDPMSSLTPSMRIGRQLVEAAAVHTSLSRKEASDRAVELLARAGIPSPERRMHQYPHELSGGMQQRVMIAMALMCEPDLLIADEPTTALDVTVQAEILDLLRSLQETEGMAILLITHDLGVIAEMCHRVNVMYSGQIVESGPMADLFTSPTHPYTEGLLASLPQTVLETGEWVSIPGTVRPASDPVAGCRFADRCAYREAACDEPQPVFAVGAGHTVRCHRADDLTLRGVGAGV